MNVRVATLMLIGAMSMPWNAAGAVDGPGPATDSSPGAKAVAAGHAYVTPTIVLVEGGDLSFTNLGISFHTLTSTEVDEDDKPLFDSGLVGFASVVDVAGASRLTATLDGYEFFCWLQPWMRGRLIVVEP
jgi:hypothetical protein